MPDWFWANGCVHPIRSSPGYDEALVGLSESDKAYLRDGTSAYTVTSPGRLDRIDEAEKARAQMGRPQRLAHSVAENRFKPRSKRRLY